MTGGSRTSGLAMAARENDKRSLSRRGIPERDIDGGWAWMITAGGFMMHFIMGSLTFSVGIFTVEISNIFGITKAEVSVVASLLMGFNFCAAPVASMLMVRLGCRTVTIIGGVMVCSGLLVSAYVHHIYILYVTLGVIPGLGMCLTYTSTIVIISLYFKKNRSIATGICSSGVGVGSVVMAPLLQWLFEMYGWRGALVITGGLTLNLVVAGTTYRPLCKREQRTIEIRQHNRRQSLRSGECYRSIFGRKEMWNWRFLIFLISTTNCMVILFTPFVFLPEFSISHGIAFKDASYIMSILSVANSIGRPMFGLLGRFITPMPLFALNMVGAGLSIMALSWCTTFMHIAVCGVIYGLSFGGIIVLLYVTFVDLMGVQTIETSFGILTMFQGFACSIGPIIAGALFDYTGSYKAPFIFSGCSLIASAMSLVPLMISGSRNSDKLLLAVEGKSDREHFLNFDKE